MRGGFVPLGAGAIIVGACGGSVSVDAAQGTDPACPSAEMRCGGACVDLAKDPDNCGACGARCGIRCDAGTCVDAESVATGWADTCAVMTDGTAWCWGDNGHGQLGLGTTAGPESCGGVGDDSGKSFACAARPVLVPGLAGVHRLVVGWGHVCALMIDGGVQCWGDNDHGELGDGTTATRSLPAPVPGLSDVAMLSAGQETSCALAGGAVACWGSNAYGELGDGTTTDRSSPTPVVGVAGAVAISVGGMHACALLGDGTAECWGANWYGQLGDGTTTDHALPAPVLGLSGAIAISAGDRQTCALDKSGSVLCWGQHYALGAGKSAADALGPQLVPGLATVSAISAGWDWTCALRGGGALACWGDGSTGQLGNGTDEYAYSPVDLDGLGPAASISAHLGVHTCAVLATGSLACWGSNVRGELGTGVAVGPDRCGYPMDSGGVPCVKTPSRVAFP